MSNDSKIQNPNSKIQNSRRGIGGPKTEEGKRRSSINGLKHGLTALSPQAFEAMAEESNIDPREILEELDRLYRPKDIVEEALVKRIASCLARLEFADVMQRRAVERNPYMTRPSTSAERTVKFERTVDLQLHRAIAALDRKREAERRKKTQSELLPRSDRA